MRIWGYSESEAGLTFANLRLEYESESGANFTSVHVTSFARGYPHWLTGANLWQWQGMSNMRRNYLGGINSQGPSNSPTWPCQLPTPHPPSPQPCPHLSYFGRPDALQFTPSRRQQAALQATHSSLKSHIWPHRWTFSPLQSSHIVHISTVGLVTRLISGFASKSTWGSGWSAATLHYCYPCLSTICAAAWPLVYRSDTRKHLALQHPG